MTKIIKNLAVLGGAICLLFVFNQVFASTTDELQPAGTITYNETLKVNATGEFNSIKVGQQGVGGVTFFNGTIINATTGTGGVGNPVTFGDDVRIDGEIYRTEKGGDKPIKISDSLFPTVNNSYSIGTSSNKFKNGYFSGALSVGSIAATGAITASRITTSSSLTAGSIVTSGTVDGIDISDIPSTYVSKSSPSWDSRSGRASIPASSCLPEDNGILYSIATIDHSIYPTGGPDVDPPGYEFYCPVQLPDGATVTSAEAYVTDNGGDILVASFYNADFETFSYGAPRTSSTNGLGSGELVIDLDSINETIDNSKNAYYISVNFPTTGSDYKFHGAVVNYTYTEPY